MIEIRPEQFEAFERVSRLQFEQAVVAHLRKHYPTFTGAQPDQDLFGFVRTCQRAAGRYGLTSELAVVVWAELVVRYGPRFDWGVQSATGREEWPRYVLNHDELAPEEKVDRLATYVCRESE